MAKSIRSKRGRKMRAIKRVRYGEKELERLKKTLANDTTTTKKEIDEVMTDISEVATVSDAKTITKKAKETKTTDEEGEVEVMADDSAKKKFNNKSMKNQYGAYPVWMHPRKIKEKVKAHKKQSKVTKRLAKKPKKKTKK